MTTWYNFKYGDKCGKQDLLVFKIEVYFRL